MRLGVYFLTILFYFFVTSFHVTDCKYNLKNKCLQLLQPYIHNGQFNVLHINNDKPVSTSLAIYSGHTYRIILCDDQKNNALYFNVKTPNGNTIYSSKNKSNTWDFKVEKTMGLIIDVYPYESALTEKAYCAGLMVGFSE